MRSTTAFYLFTFVYQLGMGATMSLYTPFLLDIGLSYSQVALVNATFWTFAVLMEVPTGMLADGRGRGWSVRVGAFLYGVGSLWYAMADGFVHAVSAELVLAVGGAFMSGALHSWVVDASDRTEPLPKVFGTSTMLRGFATILGTLVGVYVAEVYGRGASFAILGVTSLLAFAVASVWMRGKEPEHPMTEFEALRHAAAHLRQSPPLRWATVMQASYGIYQTFNMFWAPFMLAHFTQVEVGYLWIVMYLSVVAAGWLVRTRFGGKDGTGLGMLLSLIMASVPLMLFGLTTSTVVWVLLLVLHEVGRGAFVPFTDAFVHERIESGYRATYASLQSFVGGSGMALVLLVMAVVMRPYDQDVTVIPWLWLGAGTLSTVITALLWRTRPR